MINKFDSFYNNFKEKLSKYYETLENNKKSIKVKLSIAMLLLCIILCIGVYKLTESIGLCAIAAVIMVIATVIIIYLKFRLEMYTLNQYIMKDIINFISGNNSSTYEPNKRISKDVVNEMELFNLDNLIYTGRNAIAISYNGNNMNFADMEIFYYKDKVREEKVYDDKGEPHIRKTIEKVKKYVFDGCYISATLNKKIAEHIYLIPNNFADLIINGGINDYITYSGSEVELENLEFSKKYKVYSEDEIQARYILSLALMEKINNIDNILEGKKYIVFKEGRRFVICLEGFKIEDIRKTLLPIKYNEEKVKDTLKYIYDKLYTLFAIYDILDLGNDLYVDK